MSEDELRQHVNSSEDFYGLLGISEVAQENEIRRAYRKTALKYHPDKAGTSQEAVNKFQLIQLAYDLLSDSSVRELYDNARRAKNQKAERDKAYEGRRKWMKADLERREQGGALKRKREDAEAEEFERELTRLAEDGRRRRKEHEEKLRREAEEIEREEAEPTVPSAPKTNREVQDIDRSITLRFLVNDDTNDVGEPEVKAAFERFGPIEAVALRDKKLKIDGQKHRQPCKTVLIVYDSVVGAHTAVTDFIKASETDIRLCIYEGVDWAAGKAPDYIPSAPKPSSDARSKMQNLVGDKAAAQAPVAKGNAGVPSFSFKKPANSSPNLDDVTMIRLKNAERRRMEQKIKQQEAEDGAAVVNGEE